MNELRNVERIDVVWDSYLPNSIKNATREKRGSGIRTKVSPGTKIPKNWAHFLQDSNNKKELFDFLSDEVAKLTACCPVGKSIYITSEQLSQQLVAHKLWENVHTRKRTPGLQFIYYMR